MNNSDRAKQIAYLSSLVTDNKRNKIAEVLQNRTKYVTLALEHIRQPHNASAILRTCDILGVQDMHVIESVQELQVQDAVAKGATKWVDVYRHASTKACINELKKQGYTIVATTPHEKGRTLVDLPLDSKLALLFGTEVTGLTDEALSLADEFVTIEMYGFTESFNISVSVAICLHHIISCLHQSDYAWQLTPKEKETIELSWLKRILHIEP